MEGFAELIAQHYQDLLEAPEEAPQLEWLSENEEA